MSAWKKMKELVRQVKSADERTACQYTDQSLMLMLQRKLPQSFQSTIDTLRIQRNLPVADQIKYLQDKEERMIEQMTDAQGLAAKGVK
jgi:hypothetical protein